MSNDKIVLSRVLEKIKILRDELNDLVEELELLSNPEIKKQIEGSLEAKKKGKTVKYSLSGFKKEILGLT